MGKNGFPGDKGLVIKGLPASAGDVKSCRFNPWVGKIPRQEHGNPLQ